MQTKEIFDVTIIGGGPIGMFSAFYAGMRELKTKIIETLPTLGGQVEIIYPEKMVFDVGAFPFVKGGDLIQLLRQQMDPFDTEVCLEENVLEIIKDEDEELFVLKTDKATHYSRTVLITTGQGSFEPRKLTFDYNEAYEDSNLHYYVSKLDTYKDKTVAICGGGDSAVDWALTLEKVAKKVYVVHRRDKFRAHEAAVTQMKNSSIEIRTPFIPDALLGDEEKIHKVRFKERRGEKVVDLPVDYFIVNFGFISDNHLLNDWGIETERGSIKVAQNMSTNVPGIFAAGDVTTYDGKVKLIATGFGEGPTAINSIVQYLNPGQYIQAPLSADADMVDKFKAHFTDEE